MCDVAILALKWLFYAGARMTPLVPLKTTVTKPGPLFQALSDLLLSGLELVGATTGWIGLQDTVGLSFPVHIDISSDSRLPWRHAQDSVWGFTINDETAILNDLASESKWGDIPCATCCRALCSKTNRSWDTWPWPTKRTASPPRMQ